MPWLILDDVWSLEAFKRALVCVLLLGAFRLTAGRLLTVGLERVEWRFLAFHLMHGVLLGAGLAWCRREASAPRWMLWVGLGLLGGLLAEALEAWYTYRYLMGMVTIWLWQWFELPATPALIYRILQGLRLSGALFPLLLLYFALERRFSRQFLALGFVMVAIAWRVPIRGAFLTWPGFFSGSAWPMLTLYGASAFAIFYGLGPRGLDVGRPK